MDPYLLLVGFVLFSPLLGAALVFLAPVLARIIARREGQSPPAGAAGWTALLPPVVMLVCGAIVGRIVFAGEELQLALGGSAKAVVHVERVGLALTLAMAVAAGALNFLLLVRGRGVASSSECAFLLLAEGQLVGAVLIPGLRLWLVMGAALAAALWLWRRRARWRTRNAADV